MTSAPEEPIPLRRLLFLSVFLLLGVCFRLIWVEDMEYKADEEWTYQRYADFRATGQLPLLGMPSSQQVNNPGMSVWVFLGLGWLGNVTSPPGLARMVQLLNVAALGLLLVFIARAVPRREREAWLWGAALLAVNPLAVVWHRKIWAQSVLPFFSMVFLACWWQRRRAWGAFLWGLTGALLGQVHMPGFFFAAAFFLWAILFDRDGPAWRWWLAGSVAGALPMLPWLWYLFAEAGGLPANPDRWWNMLTCRFWQYWIIEGFGFGLDYTLGEDTWDFLRHPVVAGVPTFGVLVVHLLLGGCALALLLRGLVRLLRSPGSWLDRLSGRSSPTALTHNAAFLGYGLLLFASGFHVYPHYLVIVYVLRFLFVARLGRAVTPGSEQVSPQGRALLAVVLVGQALLTAQLLVFIHGKEVVRGDYGVPYSAQGR